MLILIGTVPTAYALNKAVTPAETQTFVAVANQAAATFGKYTNGVAPSANPRADVELYVQHRELTPAVIPAVQQLSTSLATAVGASGRWRPCRNVTSTTCATRCIWYPKPSA